MLVVDCRRRRAQEQQQLGCLSVVGVITVNRLLEYFVVFYQFACMCEDGNAVNGRQQQVTAIADQSQIGVCDQKVSDTAKCKTVGTRISIGKLKIYRYKKNDSESSRGLQAGREARRARQWLIIESYHRGVR